jgi:hypothetical protein
MAVPPLIAAKAAQSTAGGLQKALTGDIFTRSTRRVIGKGKDAHIVDSTTHINPVTVGVGLAATAVGLGLAAWIFQLKLTPTRVNTYNTVIDTPGIPAYYSTVEHDAVGHWSHETVVVGRMQITTEGSFIRGVWKPGQTVWVDKVQDTGKDIWVVDIPAYDEKVFHGAVPAVTHQEVTGTTKKFSIEQRRGFSAGDVLEDAAGAVGLGAPLAASRVIPKIVMDPLHVFKGKWWG